MTTLRDALTEAIHDSRISHEEDGGVPDVCNRWKEHEADATALLETPAMQAIADELEQARKDAPKVALAEAVEGLTDGLYVTRRKGNEEFAGMWLVTKGPFVKSTGPTLLDALRAAKGERS